MLLPVTGNGTIPLLKLLRYYVMSPMSQVRVRTDEVDDVSGLRASWKKLRKRASEASDNLHGLQVHAV